MCNRCLYKSNVVYFVICSYNGQFIFALNSEVESIDIKKYICKTCNGNVIEDNIPSQVVSNNLKPQKF